MKSNISFTCVLHRFISLYYIHLLFVRSFVCGDGVSYDKKNRMDVMFLISDTPSICRKTNVQIRLTLNLLPFFGCVLPITYDLRVQLE